MSSSEMAGWSSVTYVNPPTKQWYSTSTDAIDIKNGTKKGKGLRGMELYIKRIVSDKYIKNMFTTHEMSCCCGSLVACQTQSPDLSPPFSKKFSLWPGLTGLGLGWLWADLTGYGLG